MTGKLFKNELRYLLKKLFPFFIAIFLLALFVRITYHIGVINHIEVSIESSASLKTKIYSGIYITFSLLYILSHIIFLVYFLGIAITRFYINLFGRESGFTLSVGVSPSKHYLIKLSSIIIMFFISIAVLVLGAFITGIGTPFFGDLLLYFNAAIEVLFKAITLVDFSEYAVEYIILISLILISTVLQYYYSLVFGQKYKHPIWSAVACFAVIYVISQIVLLMIFGSLFVIVMNMRISITTLTHIFLILIIVVELIFITLFICFSLRMLNKNFNTKNSK